MIRKGIFETFPILDVDEDYCLREQTFDDLEDFDRYYRDRKVNKYIISYIPKNLEDTRYELQHWINLYYDQGGILWAIADKKTGKMIGSVGFDNWNKYYNRIELIYDLNKDYWNKGIATKSINMVCNFAFNHMNINRIEASIVPENIPSKIVLEKNNFQKEGILREHRFMKGRYWDIAVYSLLKKDITNSI